MTLEYKDIIQMTNDLKLHSKIDIFIRAISGIEEAFGLHLDLDGNKLIIVDNEGFTIAEVKNDLYDWEE